MSELYHVRRYRPAYFSGFDDEVYHNVSRVALLGVPFLANFRQRGFIRFTVKPYGNGELIIEAKYADGESWVAAFAIAADHEFANNFRYR